MVTRTRLCTQIAVLVYVLKYPSMGWPVLVYVLKFPSTDFGENYQKFQNVNFFLKSLIFIYKTLASEFAMSHGSYDLNLCSEILILG